MARYRSKAMRGSKKVSVVPMEKKNFAIGVRIEHSQKMVSSRQYGPAWEQLPPSDYKLACHLPDGRSAFTFCVCPGGQVVAALKPRGGTLRVRLGPPDSRRTQRVICSGPSPVKSRPLSPHVD